MAVPDPSTEYDVDDLAALLEELIRLARNEGSSGVALSSPSVLLRELARNLGFQGALRDPLVVDLEAPAKSGAADAFEPRSDGRYHGDLARSLSGFGVPAFARAAPTGFSRWGRRLASGIHSSIELTVEWLPGRSFCLAVPDRQDLLEEAVARCAETATAVLRRLAPTVSLVTEIRFDRSDRGLVDGTHGGHAQGQGHTIHLNVAYCAAYEALALRRQMQGREPSADGAPSGGVALPYTTIDGVVAHEIWHLVENDFQVTRYLESTEFRRALGQELGVPSLEHAVKGAQRNAPAPWRAAQARLVEEVSPYGATQVGEATAEMFRAWWCRTGAVTPVVARFGELVESYFPAAS